MSLVDKGNDDSDWNIQRTINFKTSDTNEQESQLKSKLFLVSWRLHAMH